jgi:hypothetical protein
MSGLRKSEIVARIEQIILDHGCSLLSSSLTAGTGSLPWKCTILFPDKSRRSFSIYVWTISHGGRTRSLTEYRIQAKLGRARSLSFRAGTTLLLGYYSRAADAEVREGVFSSPVEMEVLVAWDPLQHLHVGASSSCQVSFDLMLNGYLNGVASTRRQMRDGSSELIIAAGADYFCAYLRAAAGGHNAVDTSSLALSSS